MKNRLIKFSLRFIIMAVAIVLIVYFYEPSLLRLYIKTGIGDCQQIPLFCITPEKTLNLGSLDKKFISTLIPYDFPQMKISLPSGFDVVQETIKKYYYKRKKTSEINSIAYTLYQPQQYFTNLFPQISSDRIKDNYEFIRRLEYATFNDTKTIIDAFFIILKGIFTPDLGDQQTVKIIEFYLPDRKGFINYNQSQTYSYFDCNVIDKKGNFFKIYIRDTRSKLNLNKVFAIISTLKKKE